MRLALSIFLYLSQVRWVSAVTISQQISGLWVLFNATGGSNWHWQYPTSVYGALWNFTTPVVDPCGSHWQGVGCNASAQVCLESASSAPCAVVALELVNMGLVNSLPGTAFFEPLSTVTAINFGENQLTGTLDASIAYMSNLQSILLTQNKLTGTVSASLFASNTNLLEIRMDHNRLEGALPCLTAQQLPYLKIINVEYNIFNGTICESYFDFPYLIELVLGFNQLTGTVSTAIGQLGLLEIFNVQRNAFIGTIPTELTLLQSLQYVDVEENLFTGTLPVAIGNMTSIIYISAYLNYLTGPIPASVAELVEVRSFTVDENLMTGTLPAALGHMPLLQLLSVYDNYFTSTLPKSLSYLSHLDTIILRSNYLTGSPNSVFNIVNSSAFQTVDFSFNGFSGPIPTSIFSPVLSTLSVGGNCFTGSIPTSICDSKSLSVIALSGITSGWACTRKFLYFLSSSPKYARSLEGSLPSCVWSLANLTVLQCAGNGLVGALPDLGLYTGNLSTLDLSFNRLSGSIPDWIQSWPFESLHLTSNKFVGPISQMGLLPFSYSPAAPGIDLEISVNRLSGVIPAAIEHAENIEVVEGNLFSCSWAHQPPIHDPDSTNYVCGSNLLDVSLQTIGAAVAVIFAVVVYGSIRYCRSGSHSSDPYPVKYRSVQEYDEHRLTFSQLIRFDLKKVVVDLLSWKQIASSVCSNHPTFGHLLCNPSNSFQLSMFISTMKKLRFLGVCLGSMVVLLGGPLFALLKRHFSTYRDQYNWRISAAFLSGFEPAVALAIYWLLLMIVVYLVLGLRSPLPRYFDDSIVSLSAIASAAYRKASSGRSDDKSDDMVVSKLHLLVGSASEGVRREAASPNDSASLPVSESVSVSMSMSVSELGSPSEWSRSPSSQSQSSHTLFERKNRSIFGKWDPTTWTYAKMCAYANLIAFFVVNVLVVLSVKSVFVYGLISSRTSFSAKVLMECLLSVFDLFWGYGAVPYIVYRVPHSSMSNRMFLKVILLYFNSIVAPVLAIMLTDASCFQGLFVANESVSTSYRIIYCYYYGLSPSSGDETCLVSESYVTTSYFEPSFFYNYDCYSAVITNYSPIFLLSYCFLNLLSPLILLILIGCCNDQNVKSFFPKLFFLGFIDESRKGTAPNTGTAGMDDEKASELREGSGGQSSPARRGWMSSFWCCCLFPLLKVYSLCVYEDGPIAAQSTTTAKKKLFQADRVVAAMLHHLLILLTFGSAVPELGVMAAMAVVVTTLQWEILIGRYIELSPACQKYREQCSPENRAPSAAQASVQSQSQSQSSQVSASSAVEALSAALDPSGGLNSCCGRIYKAPAKITWTLIYFVAMFYALLLVDMLGDSVGWRRALWLPVVVVLTPCVCWALIELVHYCACSGRQARPLSVDEAVMKRCSTETNMTSSNSLFEMNYTPHESL